MDYWLIASFVAGVLPVLLLLLGMIFLTKFWKTPAGWAMFWLTLAFVLSGLLSLFVLLFPEWANSDTGLVVRRAMRFAVALPLWNLLRVFWLAQRDGRLTRTPRTVLTKMDHDERDDEPAGR